MKTVVMKTVVMKTVVMKTVYWSWKSKEQLAVITTFLENASLSLALSYELVSNPAQVVMGIAVSDFFYFKH